MKRELWRQPIFSARRVVCPQPQRPFFVGTTPTSVDVSASSASSSSSATNASHPASPDTTVESSQNHHQHNRSSTHSNAAGPPNPHPDPGFQAQTDVPESSFVCPAGGDPGDTFEAAAGAEPVNKKPNTSWVALKTVLTGALVAGAAGAAYVTYAYTSEEVERQMSAMQCKTERDFRENDNLLQKVQGIIYATGLKGVVGVAGLYLDVRKSIEDQINGFAAPTSSKLLPDLLPQEQNVLTLVLDLNETLVYSDWKRERGWRTFKRPGVEAFLEHLAQYYELVIYTDQLPFTVDPILEKLDQKGCIRYRLAREATQYVNGKHYRDLSKLNRNPARVMYLSPYVTESCLQPENGVPIKPWKLEADDTTLLDLLPFFEYVARYRPADIRPVLASYSGHDIPAEFRLRTKDYQRKMHDLRFQSPFLKGSKSRQ